MFLITGDVSKGHYRKKLLEDSVILYAIGIFYVIHYKNLLYICKILYSNVSARSQNEIRVLNVFS